MMESGRLTEPHDREAAHRLRTAAAGSRSQSGLCLSKNL
jgi:hypothetical protein